VLSNSWSWSTSTTANLYSAIVDITQPGGLGRGGKGCVVVFAAGNSPGLPMDYPNRYPEVIAVGATDHSDVLWHYSTYGPDLDLMAPSGCDGSWCGEMASFWSTDQMGPGGYSDRNSDMTLLDYGEYWGGTSASCPIVAGVAALILSVNPTLTNEDVRFILYRSAKDLGDPGWDEYYGWGRVDARAAVEMALANTLPAIYVDDDAPNDPGPGDPSVSDPRENGLAEHPFDAIQEAFDCALPGRTIVLLDGCYSGPGNVNTDFGGRLITVRSENGPQNCIIDCQGQGRGFGFQNGEGVDTVLQGITITGGKGTNGAGIQIKGSSPTIRNCVVTGNSASMAGGGLAVSGDSQPVIANCLLAGNSALVGGAVNTQTAGVVLTNCTLVGNTAVMAGGAIAASGTMPVELSNCILWDNAPGQIFGGATATYCDVQGGWPGEGNIDVDPLFADPANGDYHLKSQTGRWDEASESWVTDDVGSPCIDTGDPDASVGDEPEPNGGRINMGAYGGTTQASKSP